MPITANSLSRDSLNFIRNRLSSFIMLALLASFIFYLLLQVTAPDVTQLHLLITKSVGSEQLSAQELQAALNGLSADQKQDIVKMAVPLFGSIALSVFISDLILVAGVITLTIQVSQGIHTSALRAIGASAFSLPMLLILMAAAYLLIIFGLSLYLLPGLFFAFALVLSPIVLLESRQGLIYAITTGWNIAFSHLRLVLPMLLFTLSAKFILFALTVNVSSISPALAVLLMTALSNMLTAFMFVYLFRLYMQVK